MLQFSINHVTFKRGPRLKLSIELSQFELTRKDSTFRVSRKVLYMLEKMEAQNLTSSQCLSARASGGGNANHFSTLYCRREAI